VFCERLKKIHLVLSLGFIFVSCIVRAQEVHTFFTGARALGMGGAQIAVVNDETALLANPAGLGKLRDFYGTIVDPEVDVSQNDNTLYQNNKFTSFIDPVQISNALNNQPNTYYHFRQQLFPSFVARNFGIGLFYREQLDMVMNSAGNSINTFYWKDEALVLGYNFRFFDGRVKIGVTGKAIDRVEVNQNVAYPGNFNLQNLAAEGAGIGTDIGLILTAPWHLLPTISAVARDVGSTQFTAGKNIQMSTTAIPQTQTQDYDLAFAIFPIHENKSRSSFTVEVQKLLAAQADTQQMKYLHVGYELNLADAYFFRAGMNGHWWTAGIEIAGQNLQLQLASYGQDVGMGSNITEDRRYVAKLAFRF
jgi:hypothetical protein